MAENSYGHLKRARRSSWASAAAGLALLVGTSIHLPALAQAQAAGLLQLKGHKSVGGMRASIYNALPLEGVHALVSYMKDFERRHG